MRQVAIVAALLTVLAPATVAGQGTLPDDFVYLRQIEPRIVQDIRYAGSHNFVGRPIDGYGAAECLLTRKAAERLAGIAARLVEAGLTLIVWDCYRPARAVADFREWSTDSADQAAKAEFYPHSDKAKFFEEGYLANRSRHSSGSTVDLGIMPLASAGRPFAPVGALVSCLAPFGERYDDHALDFGTGYDCLDPAASFDHAAVSPEARTNRATLRQLMTEAGFKPYDKEWWHFELRDAPHQGTYFDVPITAP
jgi:zinc D-Ala-D-Ala dipeptidase